MNELVSYVSARKGAVHLTLPLPPSLNHLYKNSKKGRVSTPEYDAWRDHAGWVARSAIRTPISGPYVVYLGLPEKMRGDIDNRLKPVLDLLVKLGITEDDRQCHGVMAWRHSFVGPTQCEVLIDALASEAAAAQ